VIRLAELSDASALAKLMMELGYATKTSEMSERLQSILANPHFATLVVVDGEEVSGMIGLFAHSSSEHNDLSGRILAPVVAERFRRRGIARDLIVAAERYFLGRKIRRVVVTTRLDRTNPHRFYEAAGYTRTGFRFGKELALPNEQSRQPTASSS
jgi:ribosomal protein S18 acetylase RimI-like enzyme